MISRKAIVGLKAEPIDDEGTEHGLVQLKMPAATKVTAAATKVATKVPAAAIRAVRSTVPENDVVVQCTLPLPKKLPRSAKKMRVTTDPYM